MTELELQESLNKMQDVIKERVNLLQGMPKVQEAYKAFETKEEADKWIYAEAVYSLLYGQK